MSSDADEIHFECPKCNRHMIGDKELMTEMITCPDCNEPFFPVPRKPDPNLTYRALIEPGYICPRCQQPFMPKKGAKSDDLLLCPNCMIQFQPLSVAETAVTSKSSITPKYTPPSVRSPTEYTTVEKIRNRAEGLSVLSAIVLIIGVIAGGFAVANSNSGENSGNGYVIAGSCVGFSIWLYLIAQVMHIRANTEK